MPSDEIFVDRVRYISARLAARKVGLSHNYISKLCKREIAGAKQVDGIWYVNERSLRDFLEKKDRRRQAELRDLALKRRKELEVNELSEKPFFSPVPTATPPVVQNTLAKNYYAARATLATRPHPAIAAQHAAHTWKVKFVAHAMRVGTVVAAIVLFTTTGALAFGTFAPVGSHNREVLTNSVIRMQSQVAAITSLPFVDNLATAVYFTFCPYFDDCPQKRAIVAQPPAKGAPRTAEASSPRPTSTGDIASLIERSIESAFGKIANQYDFTKVAATPLPKGLVTESMLAAHLSLLDDKFSTRITAMDEALATSLRSVPRSSGGSSVTTFFGLSDVPSLAAGSILYASSASALAGLPIGSNGLVLKVVGGALTWSSDLQGSGGAGAWATSSDDLLISPSDTTDVVVIGTNATSTTGNILEVVGNALFRGSLTSYFNLTAPRFTATSSVASSFPFASTTALSATTLCLSSDCRTSWPTGEFSTTSADYWQTQRNFFSTTSATHFSSLGLAFSTTSSDYWKTQNNFFATSSADYWKTANNFFSTTSASHFSSLGLAFSTTSSDAWKAERNFFSTTSIAYYNSVTDLFSTTSTQYFVHSSTTIPKTYTANTFTALQTLSNASTTNLSASYASSTLYFGAGLANCASENMLTWTDGRFGCEADTSGGGASFGKSWEIFGSNYLAPTTTLGIIVSASSTFSGGLSISNSTTTQATTTNLAITSTASALLTTNSLGSIVASSTLMSAYGGTGFSSYATGDLLYANSNGTLSKLPIGGVGEVLKVTGGLPAWGTDLSGGGGAGGTWSTTTSQVAGTLINYPNNASDVVAIGSTATTSAEYWFDPNTTTAFFSGRLGLGTTSPFTTLSVAGNIFANGTITGSNLTATGTLAVTGQTTLGNASTTNLTVATLASTSQLVASNSFTFSNVTGFLKATAGVVATALVNLASDVTGILPVANGGTGWGNIAANAVVLGNGTGALATTSAGTNGQVLALSGGVPTWVATTTLSTISGTLAVDKGGTGQTTFSSSQLLYGNGTNALSSVATTSATIGSSLTYSGTFGALVGGAAGTLSLNTANANTWSALQQFSAGASTTQLSALDTLYVGRTSTTTIRGDGLASTLPFASTTMVTATTASTTNLIVSSAGGTGTRCLQVGADGTVSANASACSSGGMTSYDAWTHPSAGVSATTSQMIFSGASSTFTQGVSIGYSTTTNATTTSLAITGLPSALLSTNSLGSVVATTTLGANLTAGNWTGTFDGQEGSYYLANSFSTTSADVWKGERNFFSTTSASHFSSLGLAFSTTSTDYWKTVNNFFSTTSASHFSSLGLAFSTTSADYYVHSSTTIPKTYSTNTFTSANMFLASTTIGAGGQTTGLTVSGGATTTGNILGQGTLVISGATTLNGTLTATGGLSTLSNLLLTGSTTLQNFTFAHATGTQATTTSFAVSGIASGSILKTTTGGALVAATAGTDYANFSYLFPSNATSTLLAFNGGLTAFASSTIGAGGQTTGLTINGGATTTGYLKVLSTATSTFSGGLQTSALNVTSSSATSTFANGIQLSAGCFRGVDNTCITNTDTSAFVTQSGGAANRVAFFSGSGTNLSSDADLAFDGTTLTARDLLVQHTAPIFSINDSGSTGTDFRIDVTAGSATFHADIGNSLSTDYFAWNTNNDEKMRLTEAGRLGIGTTSPASQLAVVGSLFASSTATSTFQGGGINLLTAAGNTGCFAINGTCLPTTNASSTLLSDSNRWTGGNIFAASTTIGAGGQTTGLTVSGGATTTGTAYFAGNVGIGTTSPATTLGVTGSGYFTGGIGAGLLNTSAGSIQATGNITTTAGSIGILTQGGTSNAIYWGDANNSLYINSGAAVFNQFGAGSANFDFRDSQTATTFARISGIGSSYFNGSGNVGIGTTSPYAKLSVVGEAVARNFTATSSIASIFPFASTTMVTATTASTTNLIVSSAGGSGTRCLQVGADGTVSANASACGTGGGGIHDPFTHPSATVSATTSGMIITASSTIGNGAQAGGLTVSGGATTTGTAYFAGSVGIGTQAPGALLHVTGSSNNDYAVEILNNHADGYGQYIFVNNADTDRNALQIDNSSGGIFTVRNGGNVGIATTSPWRTLSVTGSSDLGNNALAGYFTATSSIASTLPFASTTMVTATTASTTNLWVSSIASGSLLKTTTGGQVTAATAGSDYISSAYKDWNVIGGTSYLAPTTTLGIIVTASSTIGAGGQTTGLTVSGGATTTGNAYIAGNLGVGIRPVSTLSLNVKDNGVSADVVARIAVDDENPYALVLGNNTNSATENLGLAFWIKNDGTSIIRGGGGNAENIVLNDVGGNVGIGTTTPQWLLNPFSATAPQLSLSAGGGVGQWAFRNAGGNLYFATTTVEGTATTTTSALTILGSSGNVGIGNTSPSNLFDVNNGALGVTNTTTGGTTLVMVGTSTDSWLNEELVIGSYRNPSSDTHIAFANGATAYKLGIEGSTNFTITNVGETELFSVTSSGNVGVGSTTPLRKLSVSGGDLLINNNGAAADNILIGDTPGSGFPGIWFGSNANAPSYTNYSFLWDEAIGTLFNAPSGLSTVFRVSNTEMARINSTGIGIGTTSPYAKLSVVGEAVARNFTATSSIASIFPFASTTMVTATTASTTNLIVSSAGGTGTRCLQVGADGTVSANASACGTGGSSFGQTWEIGGNGFAGFLAPTTTQKVWLGQASSTVFSANQAQIGGTATTTFTSTGRVGIGDSSPDAALDILQASDSATNGLRISRSNDTDAMNLYIVPTLGGLNDALAFSSSFTGTDVAAIDRTGQAYFASNVGIATNTPGTLLSVGNTSGVNFTEATTTWNTTGGINVVNGCIADNGVCLTQAGLNGTLLATYASSTVGTTTVQFTGAAGSAPSFSNGVLTLPSNTSYIEVDLWGAGGGGGGGGASGAAGVGGGYSNFGNGTGTGLATTTATGGNAGAGSSGGGGAGGTGTNGDVNISGGGGGAGGEGVASSFNGRSGAGGSAPGGGGGGRGMPHTTTGEAGVNGEAFGGGGGGGRADGTVGTVSGSGGGGGGYARKIVASPAGNHYFTIGSGGAGGSPSGNGGAGGRGGAGGIVIRVYTSISANGTSGGQLLGIYSTSTPGSNVTVNLNGAAGSAPSFSGGVLTLPSNASTMVVKTWGGGGGGGGSNSSGSALTGGGGGGGGGYAEKLITSPSGTYYYTVGSGGTAGTNTNTGGTGNQSCFGTNSTACTSPSAAAAGGVGGASVATGYASPGGSGGAGSAGDVLITGLAGGTGIEAISGSNGPGGGAGGSAPGGGGGGIGGTGSGGAGSAGAAFGGGGGGGALSASGGAGGAGGLVIEVYATGLTSGSVGQGTAGQFVYYASNGNQVTATSSLFVNTTNSYLGIGTTTPSAKFAIANGNFYIAGTGGGGNGTTTKLLIHADGSDGSTTFTDSSPFGRTITANGNAQIDTAQSKFGGSSILLDGSGDYLSLAAHPDFSLPADFTAEAWVRTTTCTSDSAERRILSIGAHGSGGIEITIGTDCAPNVFEGGVEAINGTASVGNGNWHHVALTRSGTSVRLFVDGLQTGATFTDSTTYGTGLAVTVGRYPESAVGHFLGWIDEVRIVKGYADWTADFTVPSVAYTTDVSTSGYIGIGLAAPQYPIHHSSGALLSLGGSWTNASDRNLKENFTMLNSESVLTSLNRLDITRWNYKAEDDSILHIGPMAQDFFREFGLGGSDKSISTIDSAGVAIAGVQALSKRVGVIADLFKIDFGQLLATSTATSTDDGSATSASTTASIASSQNMFEYFGELPETVGAVKDLRETLESLVANDVVASNVSSTSEPVAESSFADRFWDAVSHRVADSFAIEIVATSSPRAKVVRFSDLDVATSSLAADLHASLAVHASTSAVSLDAATSSLAAMLRSEIAAVAGVLGLSNDLTYASSTDIAPLSATTSAAELLAEGEFASSSLATTTPPLESQGPLTGRAWIGSFAGVSDSLKAALASLSNTVVHVLGRAVYATNGIFEKVFAKEIIAHNVFAETVTAHELCLENLCITKAELQAILENNIDSAVGHALGVSTDVATASSTQATAGAAVVEPAATSTPVTAPETPEAAAEPESPQSVPNEAESASESPQSSTIEAIPPTDEPVAVSEPAVAPTEAPAANEPSVD